MTIMSETHKITKAATTIGMGTFLSRILGFLRDMVIANFFGAGMAADAFFVAFRIPNLWRRLVGEGSLTISFIPVYTEYLTLKSKEEAREVTHIAFTIAGVFTGFAGAFYANFLSIITPLMFGLWQSIQIMMMSIVGGVSSMVGGAFIGATVLYTLDIYLSRLPIYNIQYLLFGAAVVLVLLFLPKGTGLVDLWGKSWRKIFKEPEEYEIPEESEMAAE